MWLFLGISAIIFTGFNLICSFKSKNEKWFRFAVKRILGFIILIDINNNLQLPTIPCNALSSIFTKE